ncbi:MAG: hypothetical protein IOC90_15030 [Methylocystis sp.]|nr:hypothetical protein [Methylocystis sp.]MCA3584313.1 hypothetical protein [Methylocystis sp.]MCA3589328.1 hypothetical protein [Methylocystis sp.]MCA3592840.1 hypothetical protein [Methylocystis sp.]
MRIDYDMVQSHIWSSQRQQQRRLLPGASQTVVENIQVNAVAYEEGDTWIAQGIEYDIVASADDVRNLPDAFARAVIENICITEHLGRRPLQGIKPAPERFRDMYENAAFEMRPLRQHAGPDVALRLAAA